MAGALLPGTLWLDTAIYLLSPGRSGQITDVWLIYPPVPETLIFFCAASLRKQKTHEPVQYAQTHGVIFMPYAFTRQTSAPFSASTTSVSPACRSPERMVRAMSVSAWLCR